MSHVVQRLSCPVVSFAIDVQKSTSLKILMLNEMKKKNCFDNAASHIVTQTEEETGKVDE